MKTLARVIVSSTFLIAFTAIVTPFNKILPKGLAQNSQIRIFNFENQVPTFNPPSSRVGALTSLSNTVSNLTITINRGQIPFDIVTNTGSQQKELAFGSRSLDPFIRENDRSPFTVNFSSGVYSISVLMGDYGDDSDVLSLEAYSGWNGSGSRLAATTKTLPPNGTTFTSKVLTLTSNTPILSIKMIGGSPNFSNSVFYDNLVVSTDVNERIWEGEWLGILTQPNKQFNYSINLRRIGTSEFIGTSRIEVLGNSNFFGVMELKGKVTNNTLEVQEARIISQNPQPGLPWCLKKGNLQMTVFSNITSLNGSWSDPGCNAGQIQLQRQ